MLTFPETLTHKGVVVYPDDEDPNLFYCLQGTPRLRMRQGEPVFRAVFWTDQADGSGGSVAGLRGAMLNFDVDLSIAENLLSEIEEKIRTSGVREQRQRDLERAETERLSRLAQARGERFDRASVEVPGIAPVRFGSLRVTEGKAVLLQESEGDFVAWASAGGPPSLIGDNNAAFALRLGAEGAAVWHGALKQNAASIGVRFDLKFEARLPSLQIHVWAGSHQRYELERKGRRTVENRDQGCSDKDVEVFETTKIVETLEEEGLIQIEIIKGQANISDEHVSQLRAMAIDLASERVKEILKSRLKGITPEERSASLLETVIEEVNAFAEIRLTQRDVIEWAASPQATISDFFRGMNQSELGRMMALVDLADPVVSTLEVPVSVVADWEAEPRLSHVTVSVEYPSAHDDRVKEIVLDKATPSRTLHWRRLPRGSERVKYEAKAFLVGAAEPVELVGGRSNGPVSILVPRIGRIEATFKPHPNSFIGKGSGEITAVQVDYHYKDTSAPDHRSGSLVVLPDHINDGVGMELVTFRAIDAPLRVKTTFFRKSDPAFELAGEQQLWIRDGKGTMQLAAPWPDTLRIGARAEGVAGLKEIRVELEHRDPEEAFFSDGIIFLDADGDWEGSTKLVQARKEAQGFRYRYSVTGTEQLARSPWVEAEGDQTLILHPLAVTVRTLLLKLGETYDAAILTLFYRDEARDFEIRDELFLTPESVNPVWLVPRIDANDDRYRYHLRLIRSDGSEVEIPETPASGENLLLRADPQ